MKEYGQRYCPIARGSELFAERWTPIVVRNMLLGCSTFGEILDGAPGMSRSLLSQRLRELERHAIVERRERPGRRGSEYHLTEAGRALAPVCEALGRWGATWLEAAPKELDPGVVLWAVAKSMHRDRVPAERVVVRFAISGHPSFWLIVQRPVPELCRTHPGADEDIVVTTTAEQLARWHMGELSLLDAIDRSLITVDATPARLRELVSWGGQSPFANDG